LEKHFYEIQYLSYTVTVYVSFVLTLVKFFELIYLAMIIASVTFFAFRMTHHQSKIQLRRSNPTPIPRLKIMGFEERQPCKLQITMPSVSAFLLDCRTKHGM